MPLTSVVIPYVDTPARRRALGHCLRSMDAQTAPVEVILALDCGARGGSARVAEFERWLRSQSPRTRLILQRRRPRCLSASRNDGQRIARGDIIVTADGDMVLPHDFAERVVAVLEHYPRHVVSAGRQRISAPASAVANHLEASLLTRYPEQPAPDDLSAMRKDMLTVTTAFAVWERPWIAACGPLRAVRREIANAYPWDEDYSGWGYEDLDFVYRLHQDGADFHVSSVACHVEHPVTTGKTEDREHNRVLFRRKHGIDL